jgi:hypothetical protein
MDLILQSRALNLNIMRRAIKDTTVQALARFNAPMELPVRIEIYSTSPAAHLAPFSPVPGN